MIKVSVKFDLLLKCIFRFISGGIFGITQVRISIGFSILLVIIVDSLMSTFIILIAFRIISSSILFLLRFLLIFMN